MPVKLVESTSDGGWCPAGWFPLPIDADRLPAYGDDAMWARRTWDGAYFVLRIMQTGRARKVFECTLVRIDLREITRQAMDRALARLDPGFRMRNYQLRTFYRDELAFPLLNDVRLKCLEALAQDGRGAMLHTEIGRVAGRVLAKCAHAAYEFESNPVRLERELEKPWTRQATYEPPTNREYGAGVSSTLYRPPRDTSPCRTGLLYPDHYWGNGRCKCDDAVHRQTLLWWGIPTDDQYREVPPPSIRDVVQWDV